MTVEEAFINHDVEDSALFFLSFIKIVYLLEGKSFDLTNAEKSTHRIGFILVC